MSVNFNQVEKKIQITFTDKNLLRTVFTHRSYLNEHREEKLSSNERLEFLGDSILSFWVSKNLYTLHPNLPEGTLTNMRTRLVRTETLAEIAKKLNLGENLLLSRGEERGGGRENVALLANTLEALIGAIYLDGGLTRIDGFLKKTFMKKILNLRAAELKDAKSLLQEKIQTKIKESPVYKVLKEEGPDHNKLFEVGVFSLGHLIGKGTGKSKQEAEENAAQNALSKYNEE
jgi:ribonuclease-3